MLGFDGMDPRLVRRWMDEGKLPNLRKLAAAGGGVHALGTTHSPESPTAWAGLALAQGDRALIERPELVCAVYRRIRAHDGTANLADLARWLS